MAKLSTLALFIGAATAKDHFVMDSPVVTNEHATVQATNGICELCFFDDTDDPINDSQNKFCTVMSGN